MKIPPLSVPSAGIECFVTGLLRPMVARYDSWLFAMFGRNFSSCYDFSNSRCSVLTPSIFVVRRRSATNSFISFAILLLIRVSAGLTARLTKED